jgi:hypothetical protein
MWAILLPTVRMPSALHARAADDSRERGPGDVYGFAGIRRARETAFRGGSWSSPQQRPNMYRFHRKVRGGREC